MAPTATLMHPQGAGTMHGQQSSGAFFLHALVAKGCGYSLPTMPCELVEYVTQSTIVLTLPIRSAVTFLFLLGRHARKRLYVLDKEWLVSAESMQNWHRVKL